jgi:hypothetical protein
MDFDLDTSSDQIREPADDGWDNGDFQVTFHGVTAFRRESPSGGYSEDDVPDLGTPLYVLIEVYQSGNTFGYETGKVQVESWHLSYEAAKARSMVAPKDCDYFGGHEDWRIEVTELRER